MALSEEKEDLLPFLFSLFLIYSNGLHPIADYSIGVRQRLEQLLRSNGIPVPEEHTTSSSLTRQACVRKCFFRRIQDEGPSLALPGAAPPAPVDEAEKTEYEDQLQDFVAFVLAALADILET